MARAGAIARHRTPCRSVSRRLAPSRAVASVSRGALPPSSSQAVAAEGFTSRKALPSPWRGVRDADLAAVSGIDGCVFCHSAGFIGGNKTRQGALAMAKAALAFVEADAATPAALHIAGTR